MPSVRLSTEPSEHGAFSIVAKGGQDDVVCHVGLLAKAQSLATGHSAQVHHQNPPLRIANEDVDGDEKTLMVAHAVAWIPLSNGQIRQMKAHLSSLQKQMPSSTTRALQGYIVDPPILRIAGQLPRFSCVGFVIDIYELGAGITLVAVPIEGLPSVTEELVRSAWPILDQMSGTTIHERFVELRERFHIDVNIQGTPPWKLMLPGYCLKALSSAEFVPCTSLDLEDAKLPKVKTTASPFAPANPILSEKGKQT